MKRFWFLSFVVSLTVVSGVAAISLTHSKPLESRGAAVTKIAIQPGAPLSIGTITRATALTFKVEIINVSDKTIRSFSYTNYKQCLTYTAGGGGGISFTDQTMLKPGERTVFDTGYEQPISDNEVRNCLEDPLEIGLQLKDVTFTDGTTWKIRATT